LLAITGVVFLRILVYWPSAPDGVLRFLVEGLSSYGEVVVARSHEEALELVVDADVFVGAASNDIVGRGSKLRFVQHTFAGVDGLDLSLFRSRGVMLASAKGVNSFYVAELALALILALVKRVTFYDRIVKSDFFPRYTWEYGMGTLRGRKVVILGYGGIGRELARMLKPFNVKIVGVRRSSEAEDDGVADEIVSFERLKEAVEGADVLVVAVPLTKETRGLVNEGILRRLKRGAIVVNVSRGHVIDESSLAKLLEEGWISGAGLDVWWVYPWEPGGGVYSRTGVHRFEGVIATPHRGGFVEEAFMDIARFAVENVGRFARGLEPFNLVDFSRGY
jgi:D-3-phosphoglycerate dehydrogenase